VGAINTLQLTDSGVATPLRILNVMTISSGGAMLLTNSSLIVSNHLSIAGNVSLLTNASLTLTAPGGVVELGFGGTNALLTMTGGNLQSPNMFLGGNGDGTFTMSGGTAGVQQLIAGSSGGNTGVVIVSGGTLSGTNGVPIGGINIGGNGPGLMTISNANPVVAIGWDVPDSVGTRGGTLTIGAGGIARAVNSFLIG